jgi:N-acetylneuraminic acid mutarotase
VKTLFSLISQKLNLLTHTHTHMQTPKTANADLGLPHNMYPSAVTLPDGRAYFIGGGLSTQPSSQLPNVYVFNPATNATSAGPSMLSARGQHAATVVGTKIVVCGGNNNSTADLNTCEQLLYNAPSWTAFTDMPQTRISHQMVTLNDNPYVIGGYVGSAQTQSVIMHNGGSSWIARANIPVAVRKHSALALDANRALSCGGQSSSIVADCYIYTATTDTWITAPATTQTRASFGLVMFSGGYFVQIN